METMQTWFGLNDDKPDFEIQSEEHAQLFFSRQDLNQTLQAILNKSFRSRHKPPKFVLYGDWGSGKTHVLRHLEYEILHDPDMAAKVVYRELPDIAANDGFQVAHASLLDALGHQTAQTWLDVFFQAHGRETANQKIQEWTQSGDIAKAFMLLMLGSGTEGSRVGWDWLRGQKVAAGPGRHAGLGDAVLTQSDDFVHVLRMLGRLCQAADGKTLIFMLDEVAKIVNATKPDCMNHWTNALKALADQKNKEIGFIAAGSWVDWEDAPLPIQDQQVVTRFGEQNLIVLQPFDDAQSHEFLTGLFNAFINPAKRDALSKKYASETDSEDIEANTFPFTQSGLNALMVHACRNGGYTNPRDLLSLVDDFCNRAIDEKRHILSGAFLEDEMNK